MDTHPTTCFAEFVHHQTAGTSTREFDAHSVSSVPIHCIHQGALYNWPNAHSYISYAVTHMDMSSHMPIPVATAFINIADPKLR